MSSFRKPGNPAGNAGFTMIELLVALVIVGIFSTVLFQLIRGQTAFTETQTARQETQQNVRGALELLAGELRSVPGSAIERGEANRIRYYLPRAFGIVCLATASTIEAVFPAVPASTIPLGPISAERYGMLVYDDAANRWVAGPSSSSRSQVSEVEAMAPCPANNIAGDVSGFRFKGSNYATVPVGGRVALFEVVEYDVGSPSGVSSGPDKLWVRRGGVAPGSMQPLAGPLPEQNSLSFRYVDSAGAPAVSPVTTNAAPPVGSVVVTLTTRSRRSASKQFAVQTDSVTIFLRN